MKSFPFHPFLLAVFPILALYSHNKEQLRLTELILPSAIALGSVLAITALLWLFLKDIRKSAILASVYATLFLTTGYIATFLEWVFPGLESGSSISWAMAVLISLSVPFGLLLFIVLPQTRRYLRKRYLPNLTALFNVVGVILVLMPAASILWYEAFDRTGTGSLQPTESGETGLAPEDSPDIYYIVLDGYASEATLEEFYGYDNSPFTDYLEEKGFFVASESHSNYNMTSLSLPSSLNMQYVNHLLTSGVNADHSFDALWDLVRNNKVVQFLKARGYKYVHFGSGVTMTGSNENADFNYQFSRGMNEFCTTLIRQTIASAWLGNTLQRSWRERTLFTFSQMADLREVEGPKFVFAHIMCPHPPYVFGPNGEPVPGSSLAMEGNVWLRKDLYLNQLIYINSLTMTLIDSILSESKVPPIIVLQADHGPASLGQMTDEHLRERFGILNAYHLPGGNDSLLYQAITPVNSFRVIFDFYFGADFGLLEDRNYYQSYWSPYEFFDATDRLNRN